MYAVLGGHVEVVEVLLKNTHLKLEDVNSVSKRTSMSVRSSFLT